jgi:hypothetical protein
MSDRFDERLEHALQQKWAAPEHGAGFDERLWARIDAATIAGAEAHPADRGESRHGRRRWLLLAAAALTVAAVTIGALIMAGGSSVKQAPAGKPADTAAQKVARALSQRWIPDTSNLGPSAQLFVPMLAPLDDPAFKGISLAEALARIGKPLPLPPFGPDKVAKVVLFQDEGNPGWFDLGILFTSGIRFLVIPSAGAGDGLQGMLSGVTSKDTPPFSDGKQHVRLQIVAGKQVLTIAGGVQTGLANGWRVPTSVVWRQGGYKYDLVAPTIDGAALKDLLVIVAETK